MTLQMTATPAATVPSPATTCPRCRAELTAATAAGGHCPRCLLALAMRDAAASRAAAPGNVPGIEELQPLFPAYELQTLIGRGGMGAVYRARHLKLDRPVAIKLLLPDLDRDPAFAERFEREARALARLDHPGIVGIHDFGTAGGFFYLVMEFVDGANLRELLAQGRLGTKDVLAFVPQLCDALQYAHDHRIVHRDIKPENILVDQDGRVRIADFGLAKMLGQEPASLGLTQTDQAVGTPHYMAPEQVAAAGSVDHRADLYSLGVVIYEMLTGGLPIGRFQPPSAKARTAGGLDWVVMKSLESDPKLRYQQAREIKTDLKAAGASAGDAAGEPVASTGSAAIRIARQLPWGSYGTLGLVIAASYMSWVTMGFLGSIDAWHSDFYGIPNAFALALAAGVVLLLTLRAIGARLPTGSLLITAALGTLLSGGFFLDCALREGISTGGGSLLTCGCFVGWSALEVRRIVQVHRSRRKAA